MRISGKREYRGRRSAPNYKDSSKTNYYVLLEDGEDISSRTEFVSQSVYDACSSLKKGQTVNVDFDYIESPKYTGMRVVAIKAVV